MLFLSILMLCGSALAMQPTDVTKRLKPHAQKVTSITFNGENKILTGSADGTVKLTDINTGTAALDKAGLGNIVGAFFHDNKAYLAVASSSFDGPQFYPLTPAGTSTNRGEQKVKLHNAPLAAFLALNDTATTSGATDGSIVSIFKTGKMTSTRANGQVFSLAKTDDTNFLALTPSSLYWINAQNGTPIYMEKIQNGTRVALVHTQDFRHGRWAIGYNDGKIQILDSIKGNGAPARSWLTGTGFITALTGFKDPYLVSGSADGSIRIWDAANGKQLQSYNAGQPVTSIAAIANAQNGVTIAAGLNDGSVLIYKYDLSGKVIPAPSTAIAEEEALEAR